MIWKIILISLLYFNSNPVEELNQFPNMDLKNLEGKTVNILELAAQNEKTIVSFWASWCKPCKLELDAINDYYEEWQEDYGVELVAITIDNARGLAKVPGIVSSSDWPYTILTDTKQELMRALSFQTIPQTFVIDKKGQILYSHNSYTPGDELELEEVLKQ